MNGRNRNRDGEEVQYKTDDFGAPADRDYHYRIPLDDDAAVRRASWALNEMLMYDDRFVAEWSDFAGDSIRYMGLRTLDHKGHLNGLEEYAFSPRWEDAGTPMTDVDRYRQNPNGSGTKVVGSFRASPVDPHAEVTLTFDAVVDLTPTEFADALNGLGEAWNAEVRDPINWAKEEAIEAYREAYADRQDECDHEHVVEDDDVRFGPHFDSPDAVAYCEDCHAELDESGEVVA